MSLVSELMETGRKAGSAAAVVEGGVQYSYARLDEASAGAAGALAAAGVGPGSVVAVVGPRSWWRCAVVLGVWRLGAAPCSLAPDLPPIRIARIARTTGARLAVRPPGAASLGLDIPETALDPDTAEPLHETQPGETAYVVATSGSTGEPKCMKLPEAVLGYLAAWHARAWPHPEPPATLHLSPVGFDVGYQELVATWAAAAPLIVVDDRTRQDPYRLTPLIRESSALRAFLSVSALQSLVIAAASEGGQIPGLRQIFVSGEQLVVTDEVRAAIGPGTRVANHYGPSETHAVTEYWLPPEPAHWPVHPPIGTALPWAELLVFDTGTLRPFRVGEKGELVIAGDTVAGGYLGDRALTEAKFRDERHIDSTSRHCYFTGDTVRFDGSAFHFVGRVDGQLKIRGYRVEPGEVEHVLNAVPGVQRAAVVGIRGRDSVRLAAAVVPAPNAELTVAALREACRAALPDYMVPIRFDLLAELPSSVNGKIDRRAVAALLARPARPDPEGAPR